MEYVVQTNQLTKEYKKKPAVQNINMSIKRGSIYGVIGENGAGKTTLIRLITGLSIPSKGSYELFGVDSNHMDIVPTRKRMSAVVETPSIALNLTAYDNLVIHGKLLGITDSKVYEDILDKVGIGYIFKDRKLVKNFSLGMKQRLGLAIALLGNPDFIILDEPLNGLDPVGIIEMRELILKLNLENNITFLISSHILVELSKIATHYGFIQKGKLIKEITKVELSDACKKCVELAVSSIDEIPYILEQQLLLENYNIIDTNKVRIYDTIEVSSLVQALSQHNISILSIESKNESIEEYYINLMGGR